MSEFADATTGGSYSARHYQMVALKLLGILGLVYVFILAITLLGASFNLAANESVRAIFSATANPMVGLLIGLLTTAIIQSSSTTTSIIVGLVGTGLLSFESAIPMVMGANIGTTVTNTLVSLAHITRGDEFKRAFAGAIVHDLFNVCSVVVLLPLQANFNIIGRSAHFMEKLLEGFGGLKFSSPLAAITKPLAKQIIHLTGDTAWLSALLSVLLLFIALRYIVKLLKSMVLSRVEKFFQRYIFRTAFLSFVLGIALTTLVQSSSITTSLVVPLLGAGVLTLSQIYPYMMGANIGTTVTAFLASFVIGNPEGVSVAFAHLLFNVYGMAIFWPLKAIPITLSVKIAESTQRSRLLPIVYIIIMFFALPALILFIMR